LGAWNIKTVTFDLNNWFDLNDQFPNICSVKMQTKISAVYAECTSSNIGPCTSYLSLRKDFLVLPGSNSRFA
jgi:hypothetical protein